MREKVKHKVKEAHKKAKKEAKKDVTWKSRVKKDIGIPALFPYKDQLLAEQQQAKVQQAAEREQARQNSSTSALASASALAAKVSRDQAMDLDGPLDDEQADEPADPALCASSSIRAHAKSLHKVLALADVVVEVLDARDPLGTRSVQLERDAVRLGKKVLLVLNKVDLVPKEIVDSWLGYLRRSWPTLPFKSSTQSQRHHLAARLTNSAARHGAANASSTEPLMHLLKNYARRTATATHSATPVTASVKSLASITVGVVGFPNVGKSSLINSLKRSRVCAVAPTPGSTKDVQEIALEKGLKVLDCPGVVLELGGGSGDARAAAARVLRNAVKVEQISDPLGPVGAILERCKPEHLMLLYNIPAFSYPGQTDDERTREFLIQVSRSRGRVKKGGIPDLQGSARGVLRDWNTGRIPYYTVPPPLPTGGDAQMSTDAADVGSAQIVAELGAEFDLEALFARADREVLGEAKSKQELGTVVRMSCSEDQADGQLKLLGETEEDEEMGDEDKSSPKRASEPMTVSLAPAKKTKQVNFAPAADGSSQSAQLVRMGIAPVGENKQIARQARKERKKRAKAAAAGVGLAGSDDEVEMADAGVDADRPSAEEEEGAGVGVEPYSFADFFQGTKAVAKSF